MFLKIIDTILDRLSTQDGWRGVLYILIAIAGAAGYADVITPQVSALIISVGLGISGAIHLWWHKAHPELPAK
jgi:hypothetical protein